MQRRLKNQRSLIRRRIRSKVVGTLAKPRLSVFRSNKHIYVQLIDDSAHHTLCSVHDTEIKGQEKMHKSDLARAVGDLLAQKALEMKKEKVVFDRGGYVYHGRVKAVAEGSRERGLKF